MGGKIVDPAGKCDAGLKLGFTVVPAAIYVINALFLWHYDLDEAKLTAAEGAAAHG